MTDHFPGIPAELLPDAGQLEAMQGDAWGYDGT